MRINEIEIQEERIALFLDNFTDESEIRGGDAIRLFEMRKHLNELHEQAV